MLFVNKKHVLSVKTGNMKKLNTKTGQNDPSFPTLGSSQATASFLTKQQNLKNNELEEKVTSNTKYEENKSSVNKNTTNKVQNMMETNSEECNVKPTGIGNRKAFFENSGSASNLNENRFGQAINIDRVNNTNSNFMKTAMEVETRLPDLLDSSDVQVSKFLATVSKLSADKERKTGNGKLDMAELAAALSSVTTLENAEGVTRSLNRMENNNKQDKQKIKHTPENQGKLLTSVSSQEKKSSTETFHDKQFTRTESTFSHSETVTSSSTKSQIDTTKASFDKAPSNLSNAKSSFLQSIISQASAANGEQVKGDLPMNGRNNRQKSPAFIPEKDSVITELKNIINDDPAPVINLSKRSFNATPKGFQVPDLAGPTPTKKIVYIQYRKMLKSYTN